MPSLLDVQPRERFSSYSHAAGAVAAVVGAGVLLARAPAVGAWHLVTLVYGLGTIAMFTASALYHAQKRAENETGLWRRIDHSAVFLMIAGTYTPFCFAYLPPAWFWSIVGVQWGLAVLGIAFKLSALGSRRWLTVSVYLAMGWMAVIPLPKLVAVMSTSQIVWMTAGGLTYTLGAFIYALKRPNPWPDRVGFHGLFHICVVAAAVMHYVLVYGSVVR